MTKQTDNVVNLADARRTRKPAPPSSSEGVHLVNALPYTRPLERGHSKQAPDGVFGPTLDESNDWLGRR